MALAVGVVFALLVYGLALYGLRSLLRDLDARRGRHVAGVDPVPEPPPCPDCEAARLDAMGAYWLDSIEEGRP